MKMKILIEDDDPLSLRLLEEILERANYEVAAVKNGRRPGRVAPRSEAA